MSLLFFYIRYEFNLSNCNYIVYPNFHSKITQLKSLDYLYPGHIYSSAVILKNIHVSLRV